MRHVKQVLASLSVALPLLVWGVANTGRPVAAATPIAQTDPTASMPDAPGKAQTIATCTKCHSITNVTGQHKTPDEWEATITKMVGYGASGSDDDFQSILAYVTKYYGSEPPPPAK